MRKKYKHVPNDRYVYLSRQLAKFMMIAQNMSNLRSLVRTQKMRTQSMNNWRVYYTNESKSKNNCVNKRESKFITVNACFTHNSESKSIHEVDISVNTNKVKATKDE